MKSGYNDSHFFIYTNGGNMGKVYLFAKGKYREIDNLNALVRHKGSLVLIQDVDILKNMDILTEEGNNYIFIILNGKEKALIKEIERLKLCIKPKRVFVISKRTEEKYFNDLPKLLPSIDKWDSRVSDLFICIKKETRGFFNKCTCTLDV